MRVGGRTDLFHGLLELLMSRLLRVEARRRLTPEDFAAFTTFDRLSHLYKSV